MGQVLDERYCDPKQPLGVTRRYKTTSGKRAALCVTRTPTGWAWFDHRRGVGGFRGYRGLSSQATVDLVKTLKYRRTWNTVAMDKLILPTDCIPELPSKARVWLYRAHLRDDQIRTLEITWSPSLQRVIIPVFGQNERLVFWQGRYLGDDPRVPKYINLRIPKKHVYFRRFAMAQPDKTLVIVEDVLSAVRVHGAMLGSGVDTLALLGAHVPDDLILMEEQHYPAIVLWLDYDKRLKVYDWVRRFRGYGVDICSVVTRQDPKLLVDSDIQRQLRHKVRRLS